MKTLQELLRGVVTRRKEQERIPLVAAQCRWKIRDSANRKGTRVNRWFAGYFPYENPRYALVVVDLETDNKVNKVTPIFKDMVGAIYQLENEK